jgi:SAM-dependent methyltransferase
MHPEALRWLRAQSADLQGLDCVDLGGRNVNGSIRGLFAPRTWTAVDLVAGSGVDIVADVRSWRPAQEWDLVCCTEVLEHLDDPRSVVETAAACCRPRGTILITAAAPNRAPHSATGGTLPPGEHYENIDPDNLLRWLHAVVGSVLEITHDKGHGDVYARAIR